LQRRSGTMTKISYQSAEDDFKKEFDQTFDKSMSEGQIPYALVSKKQADSFQRLVKITRESIRTGSLSGDGRGRDVLFDSTIDIINWQDQMNLVHRVQHKLRWQRHSASKWQAKLKHQLK